MFQQWWIPNPSPGRSSFDPLQNGVCRVNRIDTILLEPLQGAAVLPIHSLPMSLGGQAEEGLNLVERMREREIKKTLRTPFT